MAQLARKHNIHLLTNFETSWYPTTEHTARLVHDSNLTGGIRKAVFHHGHQGPKKIRVGPEFFNWLTDPVQNGGGALVDFGCYGANIMTYLMKGETPVSVMAITQNFQKETYPQVDDEATIIVNYPSAQCIIQASWNWPFNRKDMEVYGETGYIITTDNTQMRIRRSGARSEEALQVTTAEVPVYTDPFSYFAQVVRGNIKLAPYSLYSLENNLIVVRILDAARKSAQTGKTVRLQ
jgi:predicted dehydrogenase